MKDEPLSEASPAVVLDLLFDQRREVEVLIVLVGLRSRVAEESLLVELLRRLIKARKRRRERRQH